MAKLTFSFSNQAGDIPTYEFLDEEIQNEKFVFIGKQLDLCDDKVFVCFPYFLGNYEKNHTNFFITNNSNEAEIYFYDYYRNYKDYDNEELDFNFFSFENYEEAFKYCLDLKEGL